MQRAVARGQSLSSALLLSVVGFAEGKLHLIFKVITPPLLLVKRLRVQARITGRAVGDGATAALAAVRYLQTAEWTE
jgi:hypothetical protein